jgi:hypothetical protein
MQTAKVLNGTPAVVIAAVADLKGLRPTLLSAQIGSRRVAWVLATPKTKDGTKHPGYSRPPTGRGRTGSTGNPGQLWPEVVKR